MPHVARTTTNLDDDRADGAADVSARVLRAGVQSAYMLAYTSADAPLHAEECPLLDTRRVTAVTHPPTVTQQIV